MFYRSQDEKTKPILQALKLPQAKLKQRITAIIHGLIGHENKAKQSQF